jgi:hypothetical protein
VSRPRASDSMGSTRSDAASMHATAVPREPLIADRIGQRRATDKLWSKTSRVDS